MKYEKLKMEIVHREDMTEEEKFWECVELIKTLTPEELMRVTAILKMETEIKKMDDETKKKVPDSRLFH